MEADDLNAPLGQTKKQSRLPKLPVAAPQVLAGVLGAAGLVVVLWAAFVNDPLGGEPLAVVATKSAGPAADGAAGDGKEHSRYDGDPGKKAAAEKAAEPPPGSKTVTIIDGSSGKSTDVVIPGTGSEAGSPAPKLPATKSTGGGEPKLLETSRHGAIPKVGVDGAKAFTVYAKPRNLSAALKDMPRIAIIIGGMGISASGTAEAFAKLPGPVTFALAPYATDVSKLAERARSEDHEVLLQAPMEPFDYPDNDPGPQTLLTSVTAEQNVDRLQWLMSRMQGYVGIVSYMGARFTAAEQALSPVLNETAKRGLIFVDSGASNRSVASQIAGSQNLPFAKADIVLDTVPTAADIDRALSRLEMLARDGGTAVGFATAQPNTIARIAEWAAKIEKRGFVLVPISMAVNKAKSS
ncbi:MAG: divergent polysaccharide deacetylase family protein [Pseudolabrys sp.]|nr:divergent polysaccharide deacetylase family protein [Pseudolabrys sp.]